MQVINRCSETDSVINTKIILSKARSTKQTCFYSVSKILKAVNIVVLSFILVQCLLVVYRNMIHQFRLKLIKLTNIFSLVV